MRTYPVQADGTIKVERGATGEVRFFKTEEEARRFIFRAADRNQLWRAEA